MKLAAYSYFEISLNLAQDTSESRAKACDFFTESGIAPHEIVFFETGNQISVCGYTRSPKIVKRMRSRKEEVLGRGFKLKTKLLVREDWFDKWQTNYQIMPIGTKFTLVPLWHIKKYKTAGRRIPIYLDPKGASGSGQHPTTQIMALFLEMIQGKFSSCLDLGAGTGILGVLAAKLGAEEVTAVDNDSVAVKASKFNLYYNRVKKFKVISGDVIKNRKSRRTYDLVCANLISPVLETIQDFLFSSVRKGGYLAVSGVHVQNFKKFHKEFHNQKFRSLRILKKRGWTGILFKRTA